MSLTQSVPPQAVAGTGVVERSSNPVNGKDRTAEQGWTGDDVAVEAGLPHKPTHVPLFRTVGVRTALGFAALAASFFGAQAILGGGQALLIAGLATACWVASLSLTHKYLHKYPQRYNAYLVASHGKAALVMGALLLLATLLVGEAIAPIAVVALGFVAFVALDGLLSAPRRRRTEKIPAGRDRPWEVHAIDSSAPGGDDGEGLAADAVEKEGSVPADGALLARVSEDLDEHTADMIRTHAPGLSGGAGDLLVLEPGAARTQEFARPARLIASKARINDTRRINRFLLACTDRLEMGGYLATRYVPLNRVDEQFNAPDAGLLTKIGVVLRFGWQRAFPKIPVINKLYFAITKGKNRQLSKAEMWGRLASCGLNVVAESTVDGEIHLLARRDEPAAESRQASYYPVVALQKVALDGVVIRTHKMRSMYPFSEFIQKRVFEDNGLAETGKFANDFRITEYGGFVRKIWFDELPQIFDWLRGDIKLVGIRATSRHFLSLYPDDFLDLYVQVKPGLVPPLFDEDTSGFEQIVEIERRYLEKYWRQPMRTDARLLIQTFTDIVFKGVRSR